MKKPLQKVPIRVPNAELSSRGAMIKPGTTVQQWQEMGSKFSECHDGLKFWLGDWFNFGQKHFPKHVQQTLDLLDIEQGTVREYASTAAKIPASRRSPKLSFNHHKAIADQVPGPKQLQLIKRTEEQGWAVPELRRQIAARNSGDYAEPGVRLVSFVPRRWVQDFLRWEKGQDFEEWDSEHLESLKTELIPVLASLRSLFGGDGDQSTAPPVIKTRQNANLGVSD